MKKIISNLIGFSIKNKGFVFVLTVVLIIAGVISYRSTPIEAFPDVTNTQITLITQWPGRSAEEIEKFVTIPVEIAMNSVPKKTDVRSTTLFGLSVVKILFEDEVTDDYARVQVNNMLMNVDLPDGVKPEVQPPYGPTGEIFRYTLKSKTRTARDLKTIQDWVIDRNLRSVAGVADIVSFGGEVKTYEISINPSQLFKYQISPLDIYEAVSKSNINVGGDVISKNNQAYVVRGIGLLNNIKDIENIIITNNDGTPVYIKNVAQVQESAMPRMGQVGRANDNDVVEGIIVMRKGEDAQVVINRIKDKIEELNTRILPADVQIDIFYNRETLINYAVKTVSHNLMEGILLVSFIVLIFMADWRTTLIISIVIPLALLFAFICLRLRGMSANLLSMGAIDFGIIVDGAVVMVEGIFVALDHHAHKHGMEKFNKMSKVGIIRKTGTEMGKAVFFSKLIIITCLLPIFAFQKVEGKMFSPLAFTLGFALLGALICTLTIVPLLASLLLKKNVREKRNVFVEFITNNSMRIFNFGYQRKKFTLLVATVAVGLGLFSFKFLGTEFLPQLDEGSIYVRASLPMSIALDESVRLSTEMRHVFQEFEEVNQVMSQTGRPNDGTDPTGFYNIEFHVDIKPKEEWKIKQTKEELIARMKKKLEKYPGIIFGFSQPISDNVEEAASGVKGSIAVKIYGTDLDFLDNKAQEVYNQLATVQGIEDLGILKNLGQPEMRVELDEIKMALYGVTTADAQSVVEMAIGGKAATQIFEGERKFDLRIRYQDLYRQTEKEIARLMVPTLKGGQVPISEIATIKTITGPSLIFRDNNERFIAVKFSVRGRDMGGAVKEAQEKVEKAIKLPKENAIRWTGDFENQRRAEDRLSQVVPISILLIFFILFSLFGNMRDAGLVLLNVPFAIIGGIAGLLITGTNFSISAGIGFIALFGICIQNGVILISVFKSNLHQEIPMAKAIQDGVLSRVRPVVMTALMAAIGLVPAAVSTGIGSETQKPLAIVVIGGLISGTILTLFVFPIIFDWVYRQKELKEAKNPKWKKLEVF
ncbi:efflux RND transporter permease subunit [Adhaeribacter aquaticus]|uniref:efflux RND transporter permease subunit n=1 Tax=Adhaeribacter aquaticus TaxID=299567 RepID=UPI00047A9E98|nr:CusA/CzcA family heavy metal efflux RND transporter [Adhaeribacter aquaticus]